MGHPRNRNKRTNSTPTQPGADAATVATVAATVATVAATVATVAEATVAAVADVEATAVVADDAVAVDATVAVIQIPKTIFQVDGVMPPSYAKKILDEKIHGWNYIFFKKEEILTHFEALCTTDDEFKCIFNFIKPKSKHIDDSVVFLFFKLHYLYTHGGVFLTTGVIPNQDLDAAVSAPDNSHHYSFIAVKSCLGEQLFSGIMGCVPRHPVIHKILTKLCDHYSELLKCEECSRAVGDPTPAHMQTHAKLNMDKDMYQLCVEHSAQATATARMQIKIYDEKIANDVATIYDASLNASNALNDSGSQEQQPQQQQQQPQQQQPLFTHYFKDGVIKMTPNNDGLKQPVPKNVSEINIGLTFSVPSHMFCNGINQNVIYLYELLSNIGYRAHLIVTNDDYEKIKVSTPAGWEKQNYNIISNCDIYTVNFHAVIVVGVQLSTTIIRQLQYMHVKTVAYVCGNEYLMHSESILYKLKQSVGIQHDSFQKSLFDETWIVPQNLPMNETYYKTLHRCKKVIEAPFIWSPKGMESIAAQSGLTLNDYIYRPSSRVAKKMATFDPNISVLKWFIPSFVLCERAYQLAPQFIDRIYLTNAFYQTIGDTLEANKLEAIVKNTNLFLDKRVFFEKRFITLEFMKTHADVAVFHQWGNPLNYVYLEMAWLGYPFVHNAHLCPDLGYYYEDYNLEQGAEVLLRAIMKHDSVAGEYLRINRERVDRYLPTNAALQQKYKKMFDDLFYEP
jgi:hypothetical protein